MNGIGASTIILGVLLLACNSKVPASEVPSIVMNSFRQKFAGATCTEWKKEQHVFEAEFTVGKTDHAIKITPRGKIIVHKREIMFSQLPAAIRTLVGVNYKLYQINEADRLEINGNIFYQLELEGNNKPELEKVFTPDGQEVTKITFWD